jgi:hypothetical protein
MLAKVSPDIFRNTLWTTNRLLARSIYYWFLVIGYWFLVIGYWFLVIGWLNVR